MVLRRIMKKREDRGQVVGWRNDGGFHKKKKKKTRTDRRS